jgi:hypothetical protein
VNYDQPRELADKSGWHYTRMRDGEVWPLGDCANHPPHATEDEARDCYTRYLLDHQVHLDGSWGDTWRHCRAEGCGKLTNRFGRVGVWGIANTWPLCDAHRTREVIAALFGQVGDSVHY